MKIPFNDELMFEAARRIFIAWMRIIRGMRSIRKNTSSNFVTFSFELRMHAGDPEMPGRLLLQM
jgi:hypothetical protein